MYCIALFNNINILYWWVKQYKYCTIYCTVAEYCKTRAILTQVKMLISLLAVFSKPLSEKFPVFYIISIQSCSNHTHVPQSHLATWRPASFTLARIPWLAQNWICGNALAERFANKTSRLVTRILCCTSDWSTIITGSFLCSTTRRHPIWNVKSRYRKWYILISIWTDDFGL